MNGGHTLLDSEISLSDCSFVTAICVHYEILQTAVFMNEKFDL